MTPLISIVIPAYNIEAYISDTLDSVFAQTYTDIEVIAVDDGSTDKTGLLLDGYAEKEPRLRVIHKQNGGVTKARLDGIKAAQGEYIGFVDGDDLIDPDMFERLLHNAVKYNAAISHCGYRRIDGDAISYFYNTGILTEQTNEKGLYDLLAGEIIEPSLCNKLFNKSLFGNLLSEESIMDASFRENEDLLMNYCLFKEAEKSVFEDFCPYQYLIRTGSSSHAAIKPHYLADPVKIGELLMQDSRDMPEINRMAARYYAVKLIRAAANREGINDPAIRQIKKEAQTKLRAFLPKYLSFSEESKKRKLLAVFAAYAPTLYSFIHKIYAAS